MRSTNLQPADAAPFDWSRRQVGQVTARIMDRIAGLLLAGGKAAQADYLAHVAAEMRGGG